ncbi:MAG: hypothetical protein U5L96_11550 [Owenweeksia sp.]|nr:hypothetical protein [Owenweeksia sp.]
MIHQEDPAHPVTTTITNFQKKRMLYLKLHVPQLDIIGINTFGRLAELAEEAEWYRWLFDEPYFLAEWAIQGPWESPESSWYTPIEPSSSEKAGLYRKYYEDYIPHKDPNFLGSCVFYWGQKQEHTHTWFGLFSEEGERSQMLESLQISWTGRFPQNYVPRADSLLIDGLSAKDTLLFSPHQKATAQLFLHDPEGDSLLTEWEILPDVWHFDYRAINTKPKPINGLLKNRGLREVRFAAPAEPGVYRLSAKVTDPKRNMYATANAAFLVVE